VRCCSKGTSDKKHYDRQEWSSLLGILIFYSKHDNFPSYITQVPKCLVPTTYTTEEIWRRSCTAVLRALSVRARILYNVLLNGYDKIALSILFRDRKY